MGIGVSLAFIALGAILAFALRVDLSGLDIHLVGWILILVGLISMGFTLAYTRPRRRAGRVVGTDPAYGDEPGTIVREEHIVQDPPPAAGGPVTRIERVIEHPVDEVTPHGQVEQDPSFAQDPARAQDPSLAQDPAGGNRRPLLSDDRTPHQRRR
ncbi:MULTISPECIES: DUF6458 family protein [Actinomadura]|uniref:DUF6458 domain-containing protein n=1 Tax=Actinomadura litoris TaxID=2678616 RepID=A0A7K1L0D0_9ACTN|nr:MULTISPECIES: DUF6458 family protein [Actinomadura]MBT2207005.1 hypothetical protein [Actinomadura sp. NEAU-AAG7]MUN37894.1 hypothetical protein [Actinomadura litoris]